MHITYRSKKDGTVTVAAFERHTMSRTMRRYPARDYEAVEGDFSGHTVRLVGGRERQLDTLIGYLLGH